VNVASDPGDAGCPAALDDEAGETTPAAVADEAGLNETAANGRHNNPARVRSRGWHPLSMAR